MFVNLQQGSRDWLRWRQSGLGGSDAPTVAGFWGEFHDLWSRKVAQMSGDDGAEKTGNAAMKWGQDHEEAARELYVDVVGVKVYPICAIHDTDTWAKASLDGWSPGLELVLEIKSPYNPRRHQTVVSSRRIPDYYYPQVQHQLYVAGGRAAHFWSYDPRRSGPTQGILVEVARDEEYINTLIKMERRFWQQVVAKEPPSLDVAGCGRLADLYQANHLTVLV